MLEVTSQEAETRTRFAEGAHAPVSIVSGKLQLNAQKRSDAGYGNGHNKELEHGNEPTIGHD
jgi:hypothetical protein